MRKFRAMHGCQVLQLYCTVLYCTVLCQVLPLYGTLDLVPDTEEQLPVCRRESMWSMMPLMRSPIELERQPIHWSQQSRRRPSL